METYWTKQTTETTYPAFSGEQTADVAVIGGGLAGLMAAEELSARGKTVCVLEADRVGGGETAGSSAMVTFAHDLVYQQLVKKHGEETAAAYYGLMRDGLETVRTLARTLDCGYRECDFILYATTKKGARKLAKEAAVYDRLGAAVQATDRTELPFPVVKALRIEKQFCLDPYRFAKGLAERLTERGVRIFETTRVTDKPENGLLTLDKGTVRAADFIIATHFPYIDFPGLYFAKMYQSRSHNVVFPGELTDMYESAEEAGYEFRPVPDGILCGGAAVRTGKYKHNSFYRKVESYVHGAYGDGVQITDRFSAQDCMSFDSMPFAGRLDDGLHVVTGFNKWGFTTAAACVRLIADGLDRPDRANIFAPDRAYFVLSPLKTLRHLGTAAAEYADLLISAEAKKLRRIGPGQGAVVRYRGHRLGVYRTEDGRLQAIVAVCPHLGCALKWNKDERTWDCPCHGSRFTPDGTVVCAPAVRPTHTAEVCDE